MNHTLPGRADIIKLLKKITLEKILSEIEFWKHFLNKSQNIWTIILEINRLDFTKAKENSVLRKTLLKN